MVGRIPESIRSGSALRSGNSKEGSFVQVIAGSESDPRSGPRSNVFLMAMLDVGSSAFPVRVRNLSLHGALLEAAQLPRDGTAVRLMRGSLYAAGEVAWQSDRHCGVRFNRPMDVEEWVKCAGPIGQQRIDSIVAEYRDGGIRSSHLALLSDNDDRDILEHVGSDLLRTCERIAALPDLSIELAEELLKIEAAALKIKSTIRSFQ